MRQVNAMCGMCVLAVSVLFGMSAPLFGSSISALNGGDADLSGAQTQADVNLALGKPYTVEDPWLDPQWVQTEKSHPDPNGTKLTDGVYGATALANFVGYLRDDYRNIDVDLGDIQTVHTISAGFLQWVGAGIYFPEEVTFYLSSDGTHWARIGTARTKIPLDTTTSASGSSTIYQTFALSGFQYAARYIRVHFQTHVWVFCDEVQAWGLTTISGSVPFPRVTRPEVTQPLGFPQPGPRTGGASQQTLIYNGYTANNTSTWTVADFKPYVTYVDASGNSKSMLFDSFLFLPEGTAPSGNSFGAAGKPSDQADWQYYIDNTFDPVNQLTALNAAVANAHTDLHNNLTPRVVIAIPYPSPAQTQFSSGVNFNQSQVGDRVALRNRFNAIKWYVDSVIQNWNSAGYENLRFLGFYWYDENIEYGKSTIEVPLIQRVAEYVHSRGYRFYWIPDYQGQGFQIWQKLGFDVTNMQPNYYTAPATVPAQRLAVAAAIAKQYGMGIEIEMDNNVLNMTPSGATYRGKVQSYFSYGSTEGYKGMFCNWYQGIRTLEDASQSTNAAPHAIYDSAEQWMMPTYQWTQRRDGRWNAGEPDGMGDQQER